VPEKTGFVSFSMPVHANYREQRSEISHFYIGPQGVHIHQISLKSGEVEV
jgi:hypothetical protein